MKFSAVFCPIPKDEVPWQHAAMDEETRKSISKRLKDSSPTFWAKLPEQTQRLVVQKCYDLQGVGSIGLRSVLRDIASTRKNLATLYLGILFGVVGNIGAALILKYIPDNPLVDIALGGGIVIFLFWLIEQFDKIIAEQLAADHVLEHLYTMVEKEQDDSQK